MTVRKGKERIIASGESKEDRINLEVDSVLDFLCINKEIDSEEKKLTKTILTNVFDKNNSSINLEAYEIDKDIINKVDEIMDLPMVVATNMIASMFVASLEESNDGFAMKHPDISEEGPLAVELVNLVVPMASSLIEIMSKPFKVKFPKQSERAEFVFKVYKDVRDKGLLDEGVLLYFVLDRYEKEYGVKKARSFEDIAVMFRDIKNNPLLDKINNFDNPRDAAKFKGKIIKQAAEDAGHIFDFDAYPISEVVYLVETQIYDPDSPVDFDSLGIDPKITERLRARGQNMYTLMVYINICTAEEDGFNTREELSRVKDLLTGTKTKIERIKRGEEDMREDILIASSYNAYNSIYGKSEIEEGKNFVDLISLEDVRKLIKDSYELCESLDILDKGAVLYVYINKIRDFIRKGGK